MSLSFLSGANQLDQLLGSVVVIVGAARSGKTLIGNLLGSCQQVEHIDEHWLANSLPVMAAHDLVSESLAIQLLQTYTVESWYDRVLMRNVNFRPDDLSSVWRQKAPQEIFSRLIGLYSRVDVQRHVAQRDMTLVLTMTDNLPYYHFFFKALPGCRIIHVLREGLDVALETAEKGWFSDEQLLRPVNANPYRAYQPPDGAPLCYLPYWVETGKEPSYLRYSEFARGLYYWRRMMETANAHTMEQTSQGSVQVVNLADVLDQPERTVGRLIESFGMTKSELTEALIAKIFKEEPGDADSEVQNRMELAELSKLKTTYLKLGLPTERIDKIMSRETGNALPGDGLD